MKRLIVIIKPFKLDAVVEALRGIPRKELAIEEVRGFGRQKGHLELYSGREYSIAFLPKVRLECVVDDSRVEEAIAAIRGAAVTGRIGDGKVFVLEAHGVESA